MAIVALFVQTTIVKNDGWKGNINSEWFMEFTGLQLDEIWFQCEQLKFNLITILR